MSVTAALTVGAAVCTAVYPLGYQLFVDGLVEQSSSRITVAVVMTGVLFSVGWLLGMVSVTEGVGLSDRVNLHLASRIAAATGRTPRVEHLERAEYLRELELLTTNRNMLANSPYQLLMVLQAVLRVTSVAVLLASVYPPLALLPAFAIVPLWTGRMAVRIRRRAEERLAEHARLASDLFTLAAAAPSAKELRICGQTGEILRRHGTLARHIARVTNRAGAWSGLVGIGGWLVFAAAFVGGLVVVALRAADGDASPGQIALTVALLQRSQVQTANLANVVNQVLTAADVARRLLWLERLVEESERGPTNVTVPVPSRLQTGLELRGVGFRYAATDRDVLTGVSLSLPAGSVVALVGENGAGKSTMVKLLAGIYRPTEGSIHVDGIALNDLDVAAWRSRQAAVFQDYLRPEFVANDVVGIGDLPRRDDPAAVAAAVSRAGADGTVAGMPDGIDTPIGRSFPDGYLPSDGQWQKLALGRGMMRDDPLLLILDEPSAALDPLAESVLFERYAAAAATARRATGAITVIVSHRMSSVRLADLIVVLADGRVDEAGDHSTLMATGGRYARLFDQQARSYR